MKMKKNHRRITAMLTASVLTLSLAACGAPDNPDATETTASDPTVVTTVPAETSEPTVPPTTLPPETQPVVQGEGLDELYERMEPSAAMAGVMYLGYLEEGTFADNWINLEHQDLLLEYTFLGAIPDERNIVSEGGEVYCIIPGDPNASVTVTEWNADTNSAGKILYESKSGEPILVQGNVSDIMPNLAVSITASNGETMKNYHPCISLKDGSVSTHTEDGALVLNLGFPEIPDGSSLYHFDLYLPNEDFSEPERHRQHILDLDEGRMMQLLVENGLIPETVRYLGSEEDGSNLVLELSKDFAEYMKTLGEKEQQVFLTCFVKSWKAVTDCDAIVLSMEGQPLVTQYGTFDAPIPFHAAG